MRNCWHLVVHSRGLFTREGEELLRLGADTNGS